MKLFSNVASRGTATLLCLFAAALSFSCRKAGSEKAESSSPVSVVIASELGSNQLTGLPGAVYQSQASSPIHWQPWTKQTLERAKDAKRLMFAVIALPQQHGYQSVLDSLAKDPEVLAKINDFYVPILVDGDASREMGLLTADLCAEISRPVDLPLLLWLTYEGNPVAWLPVGPDKKSESAEVFEQSHSMVSRMWAENPEYVLKNSALDNAARRGRFEQRKVSRMTSEQPATDVVRCVRQLVSLYDPYSRSFDETGGLFPSSSLELLSTVAVRPGIPEILRERCLTTVKELLTDVLPSPIFDPLDGGVYSSRRGPSWSLPSYVRDCSSQARIAVALMEAYRATGDELALERALGVLRFAEAAYSTSDGLFAIGLSGEMDLDQWMWSVEEVRSILAPDEADWWIKECRMNGLGNLASEVDPNREYFRRNTIGLGKTMKVFANERGQSVDEFQAFFESSRGKLLDARNRRMGSSFKDKASQAGASFRMVSAFATAFSVTGDEVYRGKAVKLLERCREAFSDGQLLRVFAAEGDPAFSEARAFIYALALQAVLDVSSITSEEKWNVWSEDLATTAAEKFTGNAFLMECPEASRLIDLPVTDLVMLFDDSTAGLVSMAETRLAQLGRPLVASFSELATPLPTYCLDRPVLHTDLMKATVMRHFRLAAVLGSNLSSEMKLAVERLPVNSIPRRPATAEEKVPDGSVKILLPEDHSIIVTSPEELQRAILPLNEN